MFADDIFTVTESMNLSQRITFQTKGYKGGVICGYFYPEEVQSTQAKQHVCWPERVVPPETKRGAVVIAELIGMAS